MYVINVAEDFSRAPGPRFSWQGRYSGQDFRDKILVPALKKLPEGKKLTVILDGTDGYLACFLDEAFGKLVDMKIQYEKIVISSKEEPRYHEDIKVAFERYKKLAHII